VLGQAEEVWLGTLAISQIGKPRALQSAGRQASGGGMTTRIEFLRAGIAGAVALLFGTGARRTKYTTQQSYDGAPNVLLILADDQPPNTVRAMGDFASRFDRNWTGTGYSDVPVCGPARVGLFTGKYPHNHGATLNGVSWQVYRDGNYAAHDLLSRMRMAGYDVGYFGK
jgi:hypothetical protein